MSDVNPDGSDETQREEDAGQPAHVGPVVDLCERLGTRYLEFGYAATGPGSKRGTLAVFAIVVGAILLALCGAVSVVSLLGDGPGPRLFVAAGLAVAGLAAIGIGARLHTTG